MKTLLTICLSFALVGATSVMAQQEPEIVVEPVVFSDEELDQMLAPVALYPDTVLAHVLIAATYPLEVVQAARWSENNPGLEGDAAINAVENEDWDPSVKALVAFPDLIKRLSEDLDWTQRLGNAFLDDEARVTERIQVLRQHAYNEGNLKDLEHLEVVEDDEKIIIEPAVREVVYIPYYDTRYVYGPWWWDAYPPVYWYHPHHHHGIHYTSFYWGPRIHLSAGFFFSSFHWHDHHLLVLDHHHFGHNRYYSSRNIITHRDARRWQHNPHHRRGVDYYNARTRDYFESRKRNNVVNARYNDNDRNNSLRSSRNSRDIDQRGQNIRYDSSRRNADFVRERLQQAETNRPARVSNPVNRDSRTNVTSENRDRNLRTNDNGQRDQRVNREQQQSKREVFNRGTVKLQPDNSASDNSGQAQRERFQREQIQREQRIQPPARVIKSENNSRESRSQSVPQRTQRTEKAERSRDSNRSSNQRFNNQRNSRDANSSSRGSRSGSRFER